MCSLLTMTLYKNGNALYYTRNIRIGRFTCHPSFLTQLGMVFHRTYTQFIVHNVGRQRARLFYALLGLMMIATGVYFFLNVQDIV